MWCKKLEEQKNYSDYGFGLVTVLGGKAVMMTRHIYFIRKVIIFEDMLCCPKYKVELYQIVFILNDLPDCK